VLGYKDCCAAFASATGVISGGDVVEEFLAAKIWPLSSGWLPGSFAKLEISGLKDKLSFPKFGLKKPKGISDDLIVEEVEQEAVVLVVPYTLKEHDSFVECCPEQVSVKSLFFRDEGCLRSSRSSAREERKRFWDFGLFCEGQQ